MSTEGIRSKSRVKFRISHMYCSEGRKGQNKGKLFAKYTALGLRSVESIQEALYKLAIKSNVKL